MAQHIRIVMAVHHPEPDYLRAQIQSIAAQTHTDFSVLFVAADCRASALIKAEARRAGLTHTIETPANPLDVVRAFEFGLSAALEALPRADFFALADQDDVWHRSRLSQGLASLERSGRDMVHSDARVVDSAGRVLHRSLFKLEQRRKAVDLRGLLYRNTVTGMTTLMTRRLVQAALPFPAQNGVHFYHDLWLALVAQVLSGLAYIDKPLVDYRQHEANTVGAILKGARRHRFGSRAWLRGRAASYALAMYLARCLVLRMGQTPANLPRLNALKPFLGRMTLGPRFVLDGLGLLLRGFPQLAGVAIGYAVVATGRSVWALKRSVGPGFVAALSDFDSRVYALSPGQPPQPAPETSRTPAVPIQWQAYRDTRLTPGWRPDFRATMPSVTVLIPSLNPTEMFAGITTALDLGIAMAGQGIPVRFVATDLPIASIAASRDFILRRIPAGAGARAVGAAINLQCGVTSASIIAHPADQFLATAWWTALQANHILASGDFLHRRFIYLIQDFEPNFYPWGRDHAGAEESYRLDFTPVFNTNLLREHFMAAGHAFARPGAPTFHPSIDMTRYTGLPSRRRGDQRLLAVYGRPEVERNMFPLAVAALAGFIQQAGMGPRDMRVVSVGLPHRDIGLPGGIRMESLGKLPWSDYPDFLSRVDLGLSLMLSPHPSHPPLEMAAAGAKVVTNRYGAKDLSRLTPAIFSGDPTEASLTQTLITAWNAPAPDAAERNFDLGGLGAPLDQVAGQLAMMIRQPWIQDRHAA